MRAIALIVGCVGLAACSLPEMPGPDEGKLLFVQNCATCHGADASGLGPQGEQLGRTPPDLTQIVQRNGGTFPRADVLSTIDGYARGRHTGRLMPEFGLLLESETVPLVIDGVETPTPRHLAAILTYLESIQD